MDFFNYIKNLFNFNLPEFKRKRRFADDFDDYDPFSSPKFRRIQSPFHSQMDDVVISSGVIRRPMRSPKNFASPKEIIVLDDDYPSNENKPKRKFTSTPSDARAKEVSFQDDDDIKIVAEYKTNSLRKQQPSVVRPFSLLQSFMPDDKEFRKGKAVTPKPQINGNTGPKRPYMSTYTTRLDDKRVYQNLLSHMSRENSLNNSSQYFTPNSRLSKYDFCDRGKRILSLSKESSRNNSVTPLIDLTTDDDKVQSRKANGHQLNGKPPTVKDTIRKILDSFEDETVEIPDSESDVEILPRSPSPKPDIKVPPVNSMKTIVDTSYVSNKQWLADVVANHQKIIEERAAEVTQLKESTKKLNAINKDLRLGNLTRQIDKCLLIKDTVLPIEELEPELPQLTQQQYAMVDRAFRGNPNEVLVRKFNLNITRKDILTLAGLNWLNDEVINFYMNLIMQRSAENSSLPKVHCFNTFFYPKLLKDGAGSLRRWTKKVDIFAMDIICVPIHLGVHWCMSIIDLRDLSIKYYDSMGSSNMKCLNVLCDYLESEHMDKKRASYDTSGFQLDCVKDIPQQMNGSDCGMFSCTFAEFYSRNARFTFKQEDMPYLRSKMVVEILTGDLLIK